ncbi:MAG TPA: hypothetical protein VF533_16345 [Solirubrobacteraceae bacterium]|jgi:Ca2+-binding RTX toxin-like protein
MRTQKSLFIRPALAAPLIALGLLAAVPGGAAAASTCSFDAAAAKLTVNYASGATARISRTALGAIQVDGVTCGSATVRTVDTIVATGGTGVQQLIVDMTNGQFAPGKTAETGTGAVSEIEIVVDGGSGAEFPLGDEVRIRGGAGAGTWTFSGQDALLNGDTDADVTTTDVEFLAAEGRGGNDRLLGAAATLPLRLKGGDGDDELVGGTESDLLDGGAGSDIESGGDDADTFDQGTAANGADTLDGGGSPYDRIDYSGRTTGVRIDPDDIADDGAAGEADDVRDAVEYLVGGAGDDTIVASQTRYQSFELRGNGGNDTMTGGTSYDYLYGGEGNDTMAGGEGSDDFRAGPGNDTERGDAGGDRFYEGDGTGADSISGGTGVDLFYAPERTANMKITLADNTANDGEAGEGDNVRSDVEDVNTGKGADTIVGASAENKLYGSGGDDDLNGGLGDDTVYGGGGDDTVAGAGGVDRVYGDDDDDTVDGGTEADEVRGGYGDDRLTGGSGADKVEGESGDDVLTEPSVRDASDTLTGGTGTDTVTYNLRTAKVKVTLDGLANDGDQVAPLENDDVSAEKVIGSRTGDELVGSVGPDALDGAGGADTVKGLGDKDALTGGDGDDDLQGGEGDDTLDGGLGADHLLGEGGTDRASYAARSAVVFVTLNSALPDDDGAQDEHDDVDTEDVVGGSAADELRGDDGANGLDGGPGNDRLDGGAGADAYTGGDGTDTVSYGSHAGRVLASIGGGADDGSDGNGDGVAEEGDTIGATVENLTGGPAADTLTGDDGANGLHGAGGDDRLDGGRGADGLDGDAGRDTVDYSARTADLHVNAWNSNADDGEAGEGDRVGSSNEIFLGGSGDDTLLGAYGDDELYGRAGDDTLDGGQANSVQLSGSDVLSGGSGTDTASYGWRTSSEPVTVSIDGVANDGWTGKPEKDNVLADVENLSGGFGDDELIGSDEDNVISGGPWGDDVLRGRGGDDRLDDAADPPNIHVEHDEFFGGEGTDLMDYSKRTAALRVSLDDSADDGVPTDDGSAPESDNVHSDIEDVVTGQGQDIVFGSGEPNRIDGGPGGDRIEGGGGDDVLNGGDSGQSGYGQVDRIIAGDGNDKITGGGGNNGLDGGAGDDTFIEEAAWHGNDGFTGGPGRDTVDYGARTQRIIADNDGVLGDDGEDADRNGTPEEKDRIGKDVEVIKGGSGPDVLTQTLSTAPQSHCTALYGGPGQDTLTGNDDARDVLQGGPDGDTLYGRGGEDWLIGGPGNDVENGGDDDDTFIQGTQSQSCAGMSWGDVAGSDGADVLNGEGGTDQADYRRTKGTDLKVSLNGIADDGIFGEGDNAKTEDVSGGDGDDVLIGNGSGNFLLGGRGDDRLEGLGGSDQLWDSNGTDSLFGGDGGDELKTKDGDNADSLDGGAGSDGGEWDEGDTRVRIP